MKQTRIVCTIGPACEDINTLEKMIHAGMNIARLNFSHGTHENHEMLIKNVRKAALLANKPVAILQDLQGPKIRVGEMPEKGVEFKVGDSYIFDTAKDTYEEGVIPVGYKELHEFVKKGERMLLNDGKQEVSVDSVEGTHIHTTVKVGGLVTSHKGINVPDTKLKIRAMTDKDKEDAIFGVAQGVDIIALSFVMKKQDVEDLKDLIEHEQKKNKDHHGRIQVITKIEKSEAIKNIDEILDAADGIMVARGDLGVETPAEHVPVLQKDLIKKARVVGKPVIVATQMLDSMVESPRPTRAEISDIANAVIDHADGVMLSNETATGKFPIDAVDIMAKTAMDAEQSSYDDVASTEVASSEATAGAFAAMSRFLADQENAKAIVLASNDGVLAGHVSRYRPEHPIVVCTKNPRVAHQMYVFWGVHSIVVKHLDQESCLEAAKKWLSDEDMVKAGDIVVVLETNPIGSSDGHMAVVEKVVT